MEKLYRREFLLILTPCEQLLWTSCLYNRPIQLKLVRSYKITFFTDINYFTTVPTCSPLASFNKLPGLFMSNTMMGNLFS
ncbi:hypothetical protein D3C81_818380 [compost metagenome]